MEKHGRLTILREYKSKYPGGRPIRSDFNLRVD